MNVAVVGSSGYIAGFVLKKLYRNDDIKEIITLDKSKHADLYLDLLKPNQFEYGKLRNIDYIVFTSAISNPDTCSKEYEYCWKINVEGTAIFIRNALKEGCRVLFFSSDAVFGDSANEVYDEKSKTKDHTPYGKMKKAIEDEFKDYRLFKAIRLSYVVSLKDKFVSYYLKCISKREVPEVFHPFYRNAILVHDVVDVVIYFAFHWDDYENWVLNVAGRELISRIRIADEINRTLNINQQYSVVYPGDAFFENRPRITQMKSLALYEKKIVSDYSFSEKIAKELEEIVRK